ncbi:hypothetical protein GCM10025864_02780 [Luteimicrobium album]|uniref:DUF3467 domain-containing protein n=1 Tax=Luteimicrobium album TaxID=1054550 RepID=A0ABQ6HYF6_9MICO|nr:DUF3467 domain-containing protein [Luteimicrobium album]GMA22519.1 hypothetical protein GCM10025864_02780 [Luteimicrobium album]
MPETQQLQIDVPEDVEVGLPADFASLWHTPATFVIDFVALKHPPQPAVDESTGETRPVVSGRVVTRVRIPPEQVFELAKALTTQLDAWERETGRRADGSARGPAGA